MTYTIADTTNLEAFKTAYADYKSARAITDNMENDVDAYTEEEFDNALDAEDSALNRACEALKNLLGWHTEVTDFTARRMLCCPKYYARIDAMFA